MGTSHFDSNVVALDGDETITGFARMQADRMQCASLAASAVALDTVAAAVSVTAPALVGSTSVTTPKLVASSYITVGTNKYIFFGIRTTSATIVAEVTALVATPIKGSLYMGVGELWGFNADTTATKI